MIVGSQDYRYVLSVVDHFSRYVKFYPLKSKHTKGVIEALAQYVTDFGAPHRIILDNGASSHPRPSNNFVSNTSSRSTTRHLITPKGTPSLKDSTKPQWK